MMQLFFHVLLFALTVGCTTTVDNPEKLDISLTQPQAQPQPVKFGEKRPSAAPISWQDFFQVPPAGSERTQLEARLKSWEKTDNAETLLKRARGEKALGFTSRAETTYRQLLRDHPEHVEAILEVAQIYVERYEIPRSFDYLASARDILQEKPELPQSLRFRYKYVLGLALLANGDKDKGRQVLSDLIAAEKAFSPAYTALAHSYLRDGKMSTARFIVERGLDRSRDDVRLFNMAGIIAAREGDADGARRWYEKALEKQGSFVPALVNRAQLSLTMGAYPAAENDLQRAIALKPDNAEAHVSLGIVQKKLGRHEAAQNSFQRAIEINPESGFARYNLGLLLAEQKADLNNALRLFEEATQAKETTPELVELAKLQLEGLKERVVSED